MILYLNRCKRHQRNSSFLRFVDLAILAALCPRLGAPLPGWAPLAAFCRFPSLTPPALGAPFIVSSVPILRDDKA